MFFLATKHCLMHQCTWAQLVPAGGHLQELIIFAPSTEDVQNVYSSCGILKNSDRGRRAPVLHFLSLIYLAYGYHGRRLTRPRVGRRRHTKQC
ncbi:hypothetical protein NDU88_005582 [Pleurodeles waltl]|uniref:Uncharacterized protein n=1 Tax=Pleurodeles waltl TaxID=8319 RepID=A0AAV7PIY8_PLEWA|nr:hypothetical protein NDU88_005582 [Pleurodeles waltl]